MSIHTKISYDEQSDSHSCEVRLGEFNVEVGACSGGTSAEIRAKISARLKGIAEEWPEIWKTAISDSVDVLASAGWDKKSTGATSKVPMGLQVLDEAEFSFFSVLIKFPELLGEELYVSWSRGYEGDEGTAELMSLN